jgi:Protein of unknown function (DUF1003)
MVQTDASCGCPGAGRARDRAAESGIPMPESADVTKPGGRGPRPSTEPILNPVVIAHREERAADLQLRIADAITKFAGTMKFVYIHAIVFALWMVFLEKSPWQTLTLVVSLEAIFLSTFVMIGQNRQASFAAAKANHDFVEQETELKGNTDLTRQIHQLTTEIHAALRPGSPTS